MPETYTIDVSEALGEQLKPSTWYYVYQDGEQIIADTIPPQDWDDGMTPGAYLGAVRTDVNGVLVPARHYPDGSMECLEPNQLPVVGTQSIQITITEASVNRAAQARLGRQTLAQIRRRFRTRKA